jgi:signal transduction histidine kinase
LNFDLQTSVLFGFTFGVVFITIFYTLIRYIYFKELIYLSYSIMQMFSLLYIVTYSELFFQSNFIKELSLTFATLFAFIFAIGFYHGKLIPKIQSHQQLLIYTLILILILLTAFYHYMLFEYLPYTVIYFILFLSVAFNYKQGIKPTFIYVFGWSLICILLYIFRFKEFYIQEGFINIVVIAFAIEALLFTVTLVYKYAEIYHENQDYQQQLLQQSRLVQTGQMIENITHQYRQPLNNISYILINLKNAYENKTLSSTYFNKKLSQAHNQLGFMSKTIDDFKAFYTPTKEKKDFLVYEAIEKTITIMSAELKQKNIELKIERSNEHITVFGISNELSQVMLILLSNAKEALDEQEHPEICIRIESNNSEVMIHVKDNGKGIKHPHKLFTPYYTTKKEGLGIGLMMAKTIMEQSFQGRIEANSSKEGTQFTLFFEKSMHA